MQSLVELIRSFFRGVRPWVVVAPWEQCLRVRLGKHVRVLQAGFHLRIPIIDIVYMQSVRRRVSSTGQQTLTTSDNRTITITAALGYAIDNVEAVYRGLHHAEDTLVQLSRQRLAQYVATHPLADCTPADLERVAGQMALELASYGFSSPELRVTDFAVVKTYRLIGDRNGIGMYGDALTTTQVHTS